LVYVKNPTKINLHPKIGLSQSFTTLHGGFPTPVVSSLIINAALSLAFWFIAGVIWIKGLNTMLDEVLGVGMGNTVLSVLSGRRVGQSWSAIQGLMGKEGVDAGMRGVLVGSGQAIAWPNLSIIVSLVRARKIRPYKLVHI
jgi:hypothetical protein